MQPHTMQNEWKAFLAEDGARFSGKEIHDFGDLAREHAASLESAALVDLSPQGFIRATGPETRDFLNGQLTNDLGILDDRRHLLAAYCNPQGRVIGLPRLWRDGGDILLQLPMTMLAPVLESLKRFVLRAKLDLKPEPGLVMLGLVGPQCGDILAKALKTDMPSPGEIDRADATTILGFPGVVPRVEMILPTGIRPDVWRQLSRHAMRAGMPIWHWHDIRAGLPSVLPQTAGSFIPQMLNLDALNGISFDKGCYPGQEIVARMHYLGRLKQRLYRLSSVDHAVPEAGTEIFAPGFGKQAAGTVVDVVSITPGQIEMLAVVQIASAETDELHLGTPSGPALTVAPLPYAIPVPRAK